MSVFHMTHKDEPAARPGGRRAGTARIAVAHRLTDGRVVYLAASGWRESLAEATVAHGDPEAEALAARAARDAAAGLVVDPTLVEVTVDHGLPVPVRLRERIRALGPTVHPELQRDPDPRGGRRVPL